MNQTDLSDLRPVPLGLAKTFQEISYPHVSRNLIFRWGRDNIESLSLNERWHRVASIKNFILDETDKQGFKSTTEKRAYIDKNFRAQIEIGCAYLHSLSFSDEMHSIFSTISESVICEMAYGINHKDDMPAIVPDNFRYNVFDGLYDHVLDIARRELCPLLEKSELEIAKPFDGESGWIQLDFEKIKNGDIGAVFISERSFYTKTALNVNVICHELTHHFMLQWASLVASSKIEAKGDLEKDAESILLMLETKAHPDHLIYDMYYNDPFEEIAFKTGDTIGAGYLKLYNIVKQTQPEETICPKRIASALEHGLT